MKGTIETPKVAKLVMVLLTDLFYNVILTLEKESSNQVVMEKQLAIKNCLSSVQGFVFTHPYAKFHIEVLASPKRDITDPILSIYFKNYVEEVNGRTPLEYHIILDETYTMYEVYQSSIDGIHIRLQL